LCPRAGISCCIGEFSGFGKTNIDWNTLATKYFSKSGCAFPSLFPIVYLTILQMMLAKNNLAAKVI